MKLFAKLMGEDVKLAHQKSDDESILKQAVSLKDNREEVARETEEYMRAELEVQLQKWKMEAAVKKGTTYDSQEAIAADRAVIETLERMIGLKTLELMPIIAGGEEKIEKAPPRDQIGIQHIQTLQHIGIDFIEKMGEINDDDSLDKGRAVYKFLNSLIQSHELSVMRSTNEIDEINRRYY